MIRNYLKEYSDDYNVNTKITRGKEKIKAKITAHVLLLWYLRL